MKLKLKFQMEVKQFYSSFVPHVFTEKIMRLELSTLCALSSRSSTRCSQGASL